MSLVWDNFHRGGSEKLAMLALADWCNDSGGSLHPSVSTVARKICCSQDQARRILHKFIEEDLLSVVGNEAGGKPGMTRQYQLNIAALRAGVGASPTPGTDARGGTDATTGTGASPTAGMGAGDDSHGCKGTAGTGASQSTIYPSGNHQKKGAAGAPPVSPELFEKAPTPPGRCTYAVFRAYCAAIRRPVVAPDHAIFRWAESVKLPKPFLKLAWQVFDQRFTTDEKSKRKLYTDWADTFANYVKFGYLNLWVIDRGSGDYTLTTVGLQAQREFSEQRDAA